jgi:hypothetical protein
MKNAHASFHAKTAEQTTLKRGHCGTKGKCGFRVEVRSRHEGRIRYECIDLEHLFQRPTRTNPASVAFSKAPAFRIV